MAEPTEVLRALWDADEATEAAARARAGDPGEGLQADARA